MTTMSGDGASESSAFIEYVFGRQAAKVLEEAMTKYRGNK